MIKLFRKREPAGDARVRLGEVMALRGVHPPQATSAEAQRWAQQAAERCLACLAKPLCDEALAARSPQAFGLFCPNTHYIEQVRSGSLSFR